MPADKIPTAVPQALRARIADALSDLPLHRREQFVLRAQRWWADLREAVGELYPDPDEVAGRALLAAVRAFADRPDDLHALDARRVLEPDWFEQPAMVGYAAYAERFAGADAGLAGVAERVEHLRRLGVTYLHLRPLLKPRPAPDDDGYAVADHRAVRTELGTADDLRALTTRLREAGICVGTHLTLGYVAREHAWATAARAGDRHYRKYFHIYPDRTEPDEFEATLTAVSPGFAPSAFTYDEELDGWVWTTFHDYEWDLAWDNPDVLIELAEVSCYLANLGVEVVQLDALGFLWKRLGTTCQNQPEVHSIVQALRTVVRIACPAVIFLAEPIVRPDDAPALLGTGSHFGKLSDLAYHNALMVHIWSMLASRDARLAARALARIPAIPASSTWVTYVRNHDDIAWAIEDRDAGAVGVTGHGHRGFLSDFYSGDFAGSFADGLVFRYNPFTGDRRISGTTASLVGLGEAEATANDSEIDLAVRRVLLAYAIVMGFGGIPMIWSGDEIGALNDAHWGDDRVHADDNRWAHRPPLDWQRVELIENSTGEQAPSPEQRIWAGLRRLAHVRASLPNLHARYASHVVETPDSGVFAVVQHNPVGTLLCLHNVMEQARWVPSWWIRQQGLEPTSMQDHLGMGPIRTDDGVTLGSYQSMWLTPLKE